MNVSRRITTLAAVLILAAGCGAASAPQNTTTPSWCPHTADDGSRYYLPCEP